MLLLFLLSVAALAYHLSFVGMLAFPALASLQIALDLILLIIVVVGGRVIPMFTNNGSPGTRATRNAVVEKFALASVLLLLGADVLARRQARVIAFLQEHPWLFTTHRRAS